MSFLKEVHINCDTLGQINYGSLLLMKEFHPITKILNLESNVNMRAKKAKVNAVIDDEVFQITFNNVAFHVDKNSKVVLHDEKYVFINTVDWFTGTLSKSEEDKVAEPFVKGLIKSNKITKWGHN